MRGNARWNREQCRPHLLCGLAGVADSRFLFQIPGHWTATGQGWGIMGTSFGREEFAAFGKK
jgi:hypothetical protein